MNDFLMGVFTRRDCVAGRDSGALPFCGVSGEGATSLAALASAGASSCCGRAASRLSPADGGSAEVSECTASPASSGSAARLRGRPRLRPPAEGPGERTAASKTSAVSAAAIHAAMHACKESDESRRRGVQARGQGGEHMRLRLLALSSAAGTVRALQCGLLGQKGKFMVGA